jgi:hypothetical protein
MDVGRQVLRFSIPGSILLLWSVFGIILMRVIAGVHLTTATEPLRENLSAFAAILATIPVGFIVYQIYYVFYRPMFLGWPMIWYGRWIRLDRASQVLSHFEEDQIQALRDLFGAELDVSVAHEPEKLWPFRYLRLLRLSQDYRNRHEDKTTARAAYRQRWHGNWDVLRAVIDISEASDATSGVKREYANLSDIYHALGATRMAIWGAWFAASGVTLAATVNLHEPLPNWLYGLLSFSLITAMILVVLHETRRQTWFSASKSLLFGLRWIFDNHPELFEPTPQENASSHVSPIERLRRRVVRRSSPEESES